MGYSKNPEIAPITSGYSIKIAAKCLLRPSAGLGSTNRMVVCGWRQDASLRRAAEGMMQPFPKPAQQRVALIAVVQAHVAWWQTMLRARGLRQDFNTVTPAHDAHWNIAVSSHLPVKRNFAHRSANHGLPPPRCVTNCRQA